MKILMFTLVFFLFSSCISMIKIDNNCSAAYPKVFTSFQSAKCKDKNKEICKDLRKYKRKEQQNRLKIKTFLKHVKKLHSVKE